MIPVFKLNAAIATKHEEAIARLMWKMEAGKKKKPTLHREHGNATNMGSSEKTHEWLKKEWKRRAKMVRAHLKKHPGARTIDIANGIDVKVKTVKYWCNKFRNSDDDYGIGYVRNARNNNFNYWRAEDMPEEEKSK